MLRKCMDFHNKQNHKLVGLFLVYFSCSSNLRNNNPSYQWLLLNLHGCIIAPKSQATYLKKYCRVVHSSFHVYELLELILLVPVGHLKLGFPLI